MLVVENIFYYLKIPLSCSSYISNWKFHSWIQIIYDFIKNKLIFNVIHKINNSFISFKFLKYHIIVHMKNFNLSDKHAELS
jgi:hypothetical protein